MTPTVFLLRRGQTHGVPPDRARVEGWRNPPLSPEGRREAKRIGLDIAHLRVPVRRIVTSDLDRATESAHALRGALKHADVTAMHPDVVAASGLRPWHLGDYEGEVRARVQAQVTALVTRRHTPPPGDGETFDEYARRFLGVFTRALDGARGEPARGAVALVTHPRNVRLAQAWLAHGERGWAPNILDGQPSEAVQLTWVGHTWRVTPIGPGLRIA